MKHLFNKNGVYFIPLGGAGEIGMNLNLFGYQNQWIMVDLGISFKNDILPSIDVIMPDPQFIEHIKDKLLGLVLTHAHEDHIGAVPYLWPRLECPMYATPFTASLIRHKLADNGIKNAPLHEIPLGGRLDLGPFGIDFITLTHSIPEPNAISIRTPVGTILHTGDWKFDPHPVIGEASDLKTLAELGEEGILALVGDSTNAMVPGRSGSETDVQQALSDVIAGCTQRVLVTSFASNVARLRSIVDIARKHGRQIALAGRSLGTFDKIARHHGYLDGIAPFLSEKEAMSVARDKILIICTGSQGEQQAALSKIAKKQHHSIKLDEGDAVIFSSREIPGNEKAISVLKNNLIRLGVKITSDREEDVHVSGHPCQDELVEMYQLTRPKVAIPVHGELRHMIAHGEIATSCQVPQVIIPENGHVICINEDGASLEGHVHAGYLALDGMNIVPLDHEFIKNRQKITWNGVVFVSLVLNKKGDVVRLPRLSCISVFDPDDEAISLQDLGDFIEEDLYSLTKLERQNEAFLQEHLRAKIRKHIFKRTGRKPLVTVHLFHQM